jgi:hypothetical protein
MTNVIITLKLHDLAQFGFPSPTEDIMAMQYQLQIEGILKKKK